MVSKPLAWYPCLRCGLHAFGVVSMPLAWSTCLWHGLHAFGVISTPLAWSPPRPWGRLTMVPSLSIFWGIEQSQYFSHISFITKTWAIITLRQVSCLLPESGRNLRVEGNTLLQLAPSNFAKSSDNFLRSFWNFASICDYSSTVSYPNLNFWNSHLHHLLP